MLFLFTTAALGAPELEPTTDLAFPHDCFRFDRSGVRPLIPNATSLPSALYPVRIWYDPTHDNSADIVDDVLASVELAWSVQIDTIGFNPPFLPDVADGPEFDVYLAQELPLSAYVAADWIPDPIPGDGYSSQPSYMVIDYRMPRSLVDGFVAHEFNHASQWGYDATELTWPIWEATATAAEKWTLGPDYNWASPVSSFQEVPYMPTLVGYGSYIWYQLGLGYYFQYGAAMWVLWLDESFGDGAGSAGVELWEEAANEGYMLEPDVVDAFEVVSGMDLPSALASFAVPRFLTGDDWDPRGLEGADEWGAARAVPAQPLTAADLPLVDYAHPAAPHITGQAFVDVDLTLGGLPKPSTKEALWAVISTSSVDGLQTGLTAMWWGSDGSVGDRIAAGTAPAIELPLDGLDRLVIAISNAGPAAWDGDDNPYVPGDQVLSLELELRGPDTTTPTDTGTPPDDTGTPPTDTTTPGIIDPPEEKPRGCACTTGGPIPWGWAPGLCLLGLLLRRR
ncbi:MAG TPA: hypothetical protein ENK18_23765 [Deltaproteobacteria bacterium]|nr:hypothetical protein [Deltaproteobacteria bacterium]